MEESREVEERRQPDVRPPVVEVQGGDPQYKEVNMKDVLMTSVMQMKRQAETCEAKAAAFQEVIDFMVQYDVKAIARVPIKEGGKQ